MARKWTRGKSPLADLVAAAAIVPSWWLRGSKDSASEAANTNGAEVDGADSSSSAGMPRGDVCRLVE
jgi:hypothetical protein